jgi:hypothetical protein
MSREVYIGNGNDLAKILTRIHLERLRKAMESNVDCPD